jgi:hypothetical protein
MTSIISYRSKLLLIGVPLIAGTLVFARFKAPTETAAQTQGQQDAVQAELITATPSGFEPSEITRPQGRFLLAVDNRSGLHDLDLYLEHDTGARLNTTLSRKGKLKWRGILDLPAGRYVLRSANDAGWRCAITLVSR